MSTNNNYPYPAPSPDECNPRYTDFPNYRDSYGQKEFRIALAIVDALAAANIGSGGGSFLPAGDRAEFTHVATNSPTEIVPADPNRTYFAFQNLSGETLRVRHGADPSVTEGYIVCPGGLYTSQIPQQVIESINILSTASSSPIYGFYLA